MPASTKTTLESVDVIFKWCVAYLVKPRHVYHLLANLTGVRGNKSFKQTLTNLAYAFRNDPRFHTVGKRLDEPQSPSTKRDGGQIFGTPFKDD